MAKNPVFGRQTYIELSVDGGQTYTKLCDIESFSVSIDDEVKKSYVLGHAGVDSLTVLDDGYTGSIKTSMRDATLLAYFINQNKQIRAGTGGDDANVVGQRGRVPYFTIRERVKFSDGNVADFKYEEIVLHNYKRDIGSTNDEVSEEFSFTGTRVDGALGQGDANGANASAALTVGVSKIGSNRATGQDESTAVLHTKSLLGT